MSLIVAFHQFNVGAIERIFRAFSSVFLISLAFIIEPTRTWFAVLHTLSLYLSVTAMTCWDPFYLMKALLFTPRFGSCSLEQEYWDN